MQLNVWQEVTGRDRHASTAAFFCGIRTEDAPPLPPDAPIAQPGRDIITPCDGAVAPWQQSLLHQRLPADDGGVRGTDRSLQWTQTDSGLSAGLSEPFSTRGSECERSLLKLIRVLRFCQRAQCVPVRRYRATCPITPLGCFWIKTSSASCRRTSSLIWFYSMSSTCRTTRYPLRTSNTPQQKPVDAGYTSCLTHNLSDLLPVCLPVSLSQLSLLEAGCFFGLAPSLRFLDLSFNQLTTLDPEVLGGLQVQANLTQNPWHCDCRMQVSSTCRASLVWGRSSLGWWLPVCFQMSMPQLDLDESSLDKVICLTSDLPNLGKVPQVAWRGSSCSSQTECFMLTVGSGHGQNRCQVLTLTLFVFQELLGFLWSCWWRTGICVSQWGEPAKCWPWSQCSSGSPASSPTCSTIFDRTRQSPDDTWSTSSSWRAGTRLDPNKGLLKDLLLFCNSILEHLTNSFTTDLHNLIHLPRSFPPRGSNARLRQPWREPDDGTSSSPVKKFCDVSFESYEVPCWHTELLQDELLMDALET